MLIDDGTGGLSRCVIGIAIRIHRKYGPGLLEKAYVIAFASELVSCGFTVECETALPLMDGVTRVNRAYKPDLIVNRQLVVEVKVVRQLVDIHFQQPRTYMRLSRIRVGLLINFNVPILRHGIRRLILDGIEG